MRYNTAFWSPCYIIPHFFPFVNIFFTYFLMIIHEPQTALPFAPRPLVILERALRRDSSLRSRMTRLSATRRISGGVLIRRTIQIPLAVLHYKSKSYAHDLIRLAFKICIHSYVDRVFIARTHHLCRIVLENTLLA